jgi:hypothetical protein
MGESDFTQVSGSLGPSLVDHQVSSGFTPPNGGGIHIYGWHSLQPDTGAVALYKSSEAADFAPMAAGGRISLAMQRNNIVGCTPFMFISAAGTTVGSTAYLIGLAHDEATAHLVVVKGRFDEGLPIASAIVQSTGVYDVTEWIHIEVDIIAQPTDDVKIVVRESDLGSYSVGSPNFVEVPGMEEFVDDALRVATGTDPLVGGYAGFGYYTQIVGGEGRVDYFALDRQQ